MLFESLGKIKRNSILSAILLIALGCVLLICPEVYIGSLTLVFGYTLVVISIVMMLNFFSSNKSIMDYLKFTGSLILFLVGISVLVYRDDVFHALSWLFGFLLVLDGGRTMFHSFTYARRSEREGWWVLSILSAILILAGIVLFFNPWWDTALKLTRAIGVAVLFSSIVSAVRLVWTWPLRDMKGGDSDGK